MLKQFRIAIQSTVVLTLVFGILYPFAFTGLAQVLFPKQANGSLIYKDGQPVGSHLIGQPFDDPKYFWSRLSATSPSPYNGASSSGSNYGPLSDALRDAVQGRVAALRAADPRQTGPIPVDLVTASGSGLDPHVSPAATRSTPVASGSRVPPCPTRRMARALRIRWTTSWDVGPAGLSMMRRPS